MKLVLGVAIKFSNGINLRTMTAFLSEEGRLHVFLNDRVHGGSLQISWTADGRASLLANQERSTNWKHIRNPRKVRKNRSMKMRKWKWEVSLWRYQR